MARSGASGTGILAIAALVSLVSPAEAAVFVVAQPAIEASDGSDAPSVAEPAPVTTVQGDPAITRAAVIAEATNSAAPARAGWIPLIGALALVACRIRRPDGRTRFASAV